jgi:hypothetical protein
VHIYLQLKVDNRCTVCSQDRKKFRSVGIFKLPCLVSDNIAFIFLYFNSVQQQCTDLSLKVLIFKL